MTMIPYTIVFLWDEDAQLYYVTVPEISGCHSQGETLAEAAFMIEDAYTSLTDVMATFGEPLPEAKTKFQLLVDRVECEIKFEPIPPSDNFTYDPAQTLRLTVDGKTGNIVPPNDE